MIETALYIVIGAGFILALYFLLLYLSPGQEIHREEFEGDFSVIIPCYNEEKHIERKVVQIYEQCKRLNNQFEIIVVSDGSDDHTNRILTRLSKDIPLQIHFLSERKGKVAAIFEGLKISSNEVIIFSDSRQNPDEHAIKNLLPYMFDPGIGAVSGMLLNKDNNSKIRKFINKLKLRESGTSSTVGVYGALFAIRKKYIKKIPGDTILDDLLIPFEVLLQGKRVVMAKDVMIYDIKFDNLYCFKRMIRLIQGHFQFLVRNIGRIKHLNFRLITYLFVQKYFKFLLPIVLISVILIFSEYAEEPEIRKYILAGFLGYLLAGKLRFVIRMIRLLLKGVFSIPFIFKSKGHLWGKTLSSGEE